MSPTLSALLCLGLCLCWGIWAQEGTLPKPSLRAEPGLVIPFGESVSLWCEGPPWALWYRLVKKGDNQYLEKPATGRAAQFLFSHMAANKAGSYRCLYSSQSSVSQASDPLELMVTGQYFPPSLSALPTPQVASGHNVTFQCQSEQWNDMYALYKDGEQITQGSAQPHGTGSLASFSILAVTPDQEGTYRCYSFHSTYPYVWSTPSDSLVLRVTASPGLSPSLPAGLLPGISVFLILLFLLLLLLLCHRHRCPHQAQARLRNGGREAEVRKTPRRSDPEGTPLEKTLYSAVNDNTQTEEARQEDPAGPEREDPQEVTYAQLNLNSFKAGAQDSPLSVPEEPSLYAALR